MTSYSDAAVALDDEGISIHNYRGVGKAKRIAYASIKSVEQFEMGLWSGSLRLIGISLGRPRSWFHWGRHRRQGQTAIAIDVGKWIKPTITPDDPETVIQILREKTA